MWFVGDQVCKNDQMHEIANPALAPNQSAGRSV